MTALAKFAARTKDTLSLITRGIFSLSHNGFALLGLALVFTIVGLTAQPELRAAGEFKLMTWLEARHVGASNDNGEVDLDATDRATAADPKDLPKQQAALAYWLSRKYRVAPEPLSALVAAAYEVSAQARLEPTLILAVMAIESGFNPFAQSPVGAQGLMQVMTSVHTDKYENFGGKLAAFDPVTNLRVGVKVLQDCIARAGSLEAGLRQYVGASGPDDGGYASKVLSENQRLEMVAKGRNVPIQVPAPAAIIPAVQSKPAKADDAAPVAEKVASLGPLR